MPKHLDIMILAGVVSIILIAVLCFDRSQLTATENSLKDSDQTDLYQPTAARHDTAPAKSVENTALSGPEAKKTKSEPAWLDDETTGSQPGQKSIPAPYQKWVVALGPGASLGGKRPFPDDNAWNQPIDDLPVDPLSDLIVRQIGWEKPMHPDFGAGLWKGARIGIPYIVVDGKQTRYPIRYTAYGDESDPGPYPIPQNAGIEGDPNEDGDRHVIVVDRDNWKLYELFRAFPVADGLIWKAESGAIFDMNSNAQRQIGWTSADAAGLPIFPGLVRYDEVVEQKEIAHALRFTTSKTRRAYVPPASHWASRHTGIDLPPMGMRVRLKKDFDITPFPEDVQVILVALKKYGMILADNGSDWYLSGAPDPRWNDDNLHKLREIQGRNFEVVLMEGLVEE